MLLKWREARSAEMPMEVDDQSSSKSVYLRRNIESKEEVIDDEGNTSTYYEYEEAKLSHDQYAQYLSERN